MSEKKKRVVVTDSCISARKHGNEIQMIACGSGFSKMSQIMLKEISNKISTAFNAINTKIKVKVNKARQLVICCTVNPGNDVETWTVLRAFKELCVQFKLVTRPYLSVVPAQVVG